MAKKTGAALQRGIWLILLSLLFAGCSTEDTARQRPSGHRIVPSDLAGSFADFIKTSGNKIQAAAPAGSSPWQHSVELRFPFEEPREPNCGTVSEPRGFLLMHGYTDTPYLMRALARKLREHYPCAVIRAPVLPGHATIPGDLLETNYDEWREAARLSIKSMPVEVDQLWLVGFSTGALLATDYVLANPGSRVAGLVLISPLLMAKGAPGWLGGPMDFYSSIKRWSTGGLWPPVNNEPNEDLDPVKYESTPVHANAEILKLTRKVDPMHQASFGLPAFAAVSAEDQTVDAPAVLQFFCHSAVDGHRQMFWYTGADDPNHPAALLGAADVDSQCRNDISIRPPPTTGELVHFSHVSLPIAPDDPIYGRNGSYRSCVHYWFQDREQYDRCRTADPNKVIFGETNDELPGLTVARLTYNPDFDNLAAAITAFIDQQQPID